MKFLTRQQWHGLAYGLWIVILLLLMPLARLSAQAPTGELRLVTSPLPISLSAQPGTTATTELRVRNAGTQAETLKVELLTFGAFGEDGKPRILDPQPGDEFIQWAHFSETQFTVAPNQWHTVTMTINVPAYAGLGYYYAVTFSRLHEERPAAERQAGLQGAVATLVLLEVEVPNAKRQVEVLDFTAKRRIFEFLPASFTVRLRNSGNIHVAPRGNIFISQGSKQLDTLEVNPFKGHLLPQTNRVFETEWADGFPVYELKKDGEQVVTNDQGEQVYQLKWDFSKLTNLRFGRYTANLVLVYNDGGRDVPIEGKLTFWVVPWRLIPPTLIVLALLIVGLNTTLRKIWSRLRPAKPKRSGKAK